MSLLHYPWMRLLRVGNLAYIAVLLLCSLLLYYRTYFCAYATQPHNAFVGVSYVYYSSVAAAAAAGYVLNDIADVSTASIARSALQ